ncbi:MAG: hypothetical protein JRF42_12885 [Deltaproteobacteria bacterium]|nr:hypothetical protein [Deltaproteobacteria bacterium]
MSGSRNQGNLPRRDLASLRLLGDDFLDAVKTGDKVKVHEDGTIEVG